MIRDGLWLDKQARFDATSKIVELRICDAESTFDYMHSAKRYLARYGKPVAFYSDKHSVFRVNKKEVAGGTGLTQFGRALHGLNIDIIYANSSQAKGRVERMSLTLQDRLVKELRLEGVAAHSCGAGEPIGPPAPNPATMVARLEGGCRFE